MRVGGNDNNDGLYRCEVIDIDGNAQMLYVWLDGGSQGKYHVYHNSVWGALVQLYTCMLFVFKVYM